MILVYVDSSDGVEEGRVMIIKNLPVSRWGKQILNSEGKASEPIAKITLMEQLGEIGQRVQMLLELALRHEE